MLIGTVVSPDPTLAVIAAALPIDPRPYTVGSRPTGLIVVDVVNGFCTVGYGSAAPTEPNPPIAKMVEESARLAKAFTQKGFPVLAFLDIHEPGKPEPPYPVHCERGSGEEELVDELKWLLTHPLATLIEKDCINGFIGSIDIHTKHNGVLEWVNQHNLEALVVVGICTDICVMDFVVTMLSVRNHGLVPSLKDIAVYTEGCSTYDLPAEVAAAQGLPKTAIHPQNVTHHIGLYTMAERGAFIADAILMHQ